MNIRTYIISTILLLLGFGVGFGVGWLEYGRGGGAPFAQFTKQELREIGGGYKFVNPLLECSDLGGISDATTLSLDHAINDYINTQIAAGVVTDASIYFRDLTAGPWLGIRINHSFIPASLLKVPLMMAVLKHAEEVPNFLEEKIKFDGSLGPEPQTLKSKTVIEVGKTYTVRELLETLIENSDNRAVYLLAQLIGIDRIDETYKDLGLDVPKNNSADYQIGARQYGTFLRILYNASYLSANTSEYALSLLVKSSYQDGLVAGVPSSVTVAHKFGEYEDSAGIRELHDCGIIYYSELPYVLCVMTKGNDIDQLGEVIKNISAMVYQEVAQAK